VPEVTDERATGGTRLTRVAAYALATRPDDAVLLVRASLASDVPGSWWLPGGGLGFGEDPAAAVVREVLEETGLDVRIAGAPSILSDVMTLPTRDVELHTVRICYPVHVLGGTLTAETNGSSDLAAWVPRTTALRMPVQPFVRRVLGIP
jgi:ADP-ribose pyrophosphatase YjhB (NUDIX family)